jgi:hypothetical protein
MLGMPAPMAAELLGEVDTLTGLAEESRVDVGRAAKAASFDATAKSRHRGRQTSGGRIALRSGDDELVLEEWEVVRLVRLLPGELAGVLRPSRDRRDADTAQAIAAVLGPDHAAFTFFDAAARGDGFDVRRR